MDDFHTGAVEEILQVAFGELVEVRAVFARQDVLDFVDQAVVVGGDQKQISAGGHDALHFEHMVERIEEMFEDFEVRERVERVVGEFVAFDVEIDFADFDVHLGFFAEHVAHVAFAAADVEPPFAERVVFAIVREHFEQALGALLEGGVVEIFVGADAAVEDVFIVVIAHLALESWKVLKFPKIGKSCDGSKRRGKTCSTN